MWEDPQRNTQLLAQFFKFIFKQFADDGCRKGVHDLVMLTLGESLNLVIYWCDNSILVL